MELQEGLQAFLLQLAADGRSSHTVGQYRRHVTALIRWLQATGKGTRVTDLTPKVLASFFTDDAARVSCRGGVKKATTLNAMRTSIRCFCRHLHDLGLVTTNPARLLRRARCSPAPPKALHPDQQQRLLEVLVMAEGREAARDRMLVELLLGIGLRLGSALALNVQDVDFPHGELVLHQMKNNRPSTAILPASLAGKLKEYLDGRMEGPLFLAHGRRISTRHAQRRIAGWMATAGLAGRTAHSLRHSFATGLLARTGDLRLVQAALNHASVLSTVTYVTVDQGRLREAVG